MYNVRFIFPCDFEVNSRKKKRNKLAILGFSQNTDEEKTDEHQKGISTPVYNFLSPSISINDPNDIRWERDLYKEEVEIIVKDIYNSCFIKSDKFNLEGYAISEILYPYAIGLTKQFSKIEEVYSTISNIEKTFQYFNPINNTRKSIQPEWLIYSKPIVLVECDTSVGLPDFISDFSIQNVVLSAQLKTKNETIFYTSDAPVDAINKSIVLLAAMKYTSSYVRIWAKGIDEQNNRSEIIRNIHKHCAIFEETRHSTILRLQDDKEIFDILYQVFNIEKNKEQINASREYADYLINDLNNIETQQINKTVFITGYIGVILSFLAFIPVHLSSMIWINTDTKIFEKILLVIALIGFTIILLSFFVLAFHKRKRILSDWKSMFNWVKDKFFTIIVSTLIILVLISMIWAIVFVCSGNIVPAC